jgi:hypothetical protein
MDWKIGVLGFDSQRGLGIFHHRVQSGSGAHPASYPMGTRGSFPGVKPPGREADHSPPSSAGVKNAWSYTSTPPVRLHGVVLSWAQGQLYLHLYLLKYLYKVRFMFELVSCFLSSDLFNAQNTHRRNTYVTKPPIASLYEHPLVWAH